MIISKELILKVKENDRVAQQQLYRILLPYLNTVCRRYLINPSDINDTLQETFIKIFSKLNQFDATRGQFKTWAVKIAVNCALKYNEKMYRLPVKELNDEIPIQIADSGVLKKLSDDDLLAFFKTMPQHYFEVFNLHVIDDFSHKEIGNILGIAESLSRKRLSRARHWLASKVDNTTLKNLGFRKLI